MLKKLREQWKYERGISREKFMICPYCGQWGTRGRCIWCGFNPDAPQAMAELRARQAVHRARRHAFLQKFYQALNALFRVDIAELAAVVRTLLKWSVIGSLVGILAGTASAIFLISLAWATEIRVANPMLLLLLPIAGFLVGWVYLRFAGIAVQGNNLVIEEVNANRSKIPLRMAPLVLIGTVITHLFGGSAGREGTAIQMGSSLADGLRRLLRLNPIDRRLIIMAGISGGFASVFGTPIAGFVFGMEVQRVGRIRYEGVVPCLSAALVGDLVTRAWGAPHSHYPFLDHVGIDLTLIVRVAVAGIAFGLTSALFIELIHGIKYALRGRLWPPLQLVAGGVAIIALTQLVGTQDYLGLSLPLIQRTMNGEGVIAYAFLLKLIFTVITLGTGYLGGEVTPLFVIGSTLGYTLGTLLGVDPAFLAAVGFVAVFAGASNTPLACTVMGVELFGGGSMMYIAVGCFVAYLASGHRGIYGTQLIDSPKAFGFEVNEEENLAALAARRSGWLPVLPGLVNESVLSPIRALMSRRLVTVGADATLHQAVTLAYQSGVRLLPVIDDKGDLVGVVTEDNFRKAGLPLSLGILAYLTHSERTLALRNLLPGSLEDFATTSIHSVRPDAPLSEAVRLMLQHRLKRILVIEDGSKLAGLITRSDVLRLLAYVEPIELESEFGSLHWEIKVGDVPPQKAVIVMTTTPISRAIALLYEAETKRIIVTDADLRPVGVITLGDVLSHIQGNMRREFLLKLGIEVAESPETRDDSLSLTAADVMTTPLMTITPEASAQEAIRLMIENRIKRLPVVTADGKLLGLVGRDGLMRKIFQMRSVKTTE